MLINMPVDAISEACLTCPELEIDIVTKEFYELASPEEGTTEVKKITYENVLRCKHCHRCEIIFKHGSKQKTSTKSKTKPKTTKKTTTRKTVAKK